MFSRRRLFQLIASLPFATWAAKEIAAAPPVQSVALTTKDPNYQMYFLASDGTYRLLGTQEHPLTAGTPLFWR